MKNFISLSFLLIALNWSQAKSEEVSNNSKEAPSENIYETTLSSGNDTEENNAVAKPETGGNKIEGSFLVYGGYNSTNYGNDITVNDVDARQNNPYMGVYGVFKFKNLEAFWSDQNSKYGFSSEFLLDSNDANTPIKLNEASFVISSQLSGTKVFGISAPISSKFKVNSSTMAGGNEGISGKWQNFMKYPFLKDSTTPNPSNSSFITKPYLPLEHGFASPYVMSAENNMQILQPIEGWGERNAGVSYISNRNKGFRVGASYFPDNKNPLLISNQTNLKDQKGLDFDTDSFVNGGTYLKNITTFGTNFYDQFGNVEVMFSALYEAGTATSNINKRHDLKSYNLGFNLGYMGFTLGGSFVNYGRSLQIKGEDVPGNNLYYNKKGKAVFNTNSYVYDIGLGYEISKYSLNIAYLKSRKVGNDFWSAALSFETKPSKNLLNYFQLAKYQFTSSNQLMNASGPRQKTSGVIMLAGIKYKIS